MSIIGALESPGELTWVRKSSDVIGRVVPFVLPGYAADDFGVGCTVPEYTKEPVMPGQKGQIKVTYNGAGKFPGHFKKSITVRTNGVVEMTRLYVEGDMEEAK